MQCDIGFLALGLDDKYLKRTNFFPRYELRRCVRARTRAMCGRMCAGACEIHSGKRAVCACVQPFFGRAMCDCTFAHFLGQNCQKMLPFRTSFPALERLFLFWIILICFRTSYSVLEHTKPYEY